MLETCGLNISISSSPHVRYVTGSIGGDVGRSGGVECLGVVAVCKERERERVGEKQKMYQLPLGCDSNFQTTTLMVSIFSRQLKLFFISVPCSRHG